MPFTVLLALLAFAANSLLCRVALRGGEIDPASFTLVRLASGAAMLAVLGAVQRWPRGGTWLGGFWLAAYAVGFSWAYVRLDAGVGALLLFGCVQLTMLASAVRARESFSGRFRLGFAAAVLGVVWLVRPGGAAPPLDGALAMAIAGGAWGRYTLAGRGTSTPEGDTRGHFARALVLAVPLVMLGLGLGRGTVASSAGGMAASLSLSLRGLALAAGSGAITSGLGYVLWYSAVRTLPASRAASLQLTVPVITALLAIPVLGERPTWRLAVAALLVLGGVGLTIQRPAPTAGPR